MMMHPAIETLLAALPGIARARLAGEIGDDACAVAAAGIVLGLQVKPDDLAREMAIIGSAALDIMDRMDAEALAQRGTPS